MIKTRFLIIVCLVSQHFVHAQNIIVDGFDSTSSVEARTHKRLDNNGTPCALIKVRSLLKGLQFNEAIGPVDNKTNEYWVYVPDRSETLTISSNKHNSFVIRFADYGEKFVSMSVAYVLSLSEKTNNPQLSFNSNSVPSDFQNGADAGNAEDQCNLGKCYYLGRGVTQNYYSALNWFRKSAEQNNVEALYYIGRSYYYGQGFPKPDYEQAVKWYEKAAKKDHADAQYQLGLCYEKGQGVKQDAKMARKWFEKAAKNGNSRAKQKIQ